MRESIRPVAGAITPLALMGIRCFWPHNVIGRMGLVVDQASTLRFLPTSHQCSPRIHLRALESAAELPAPQATAYCSFRVSITQAIRAVLLASATIVRLKPRLATSAFSHADRRSSCFDNRLITARAPWIICRLR